MLYEMATGRRPFEGSVVGRARLGDPARTRRAPLSEIEVRSCRRDLTRIIRRCLEKDPRQRVQTARDVGNELRDIAARGAASAGRSGPGIASEAAADSGAGRADEGFWVAVLPFKYHGANAGCSRLWPRACPRRSSPASRASRTSG